MTLPAVDEEGFIKIWQRNPSPTGVARELGISTRAVYERRERLAKKGIVLPSVSQKAVSYKAASVDLVLSTRRDVHRISIDSGIILVGSDAHYSPGYTPIAHKALCNLLSDLGADVKAVIMNGDILDGGMASRHARIRWHKAPTIQQELEAVKERLGDIEKIRPAGCLLLRTYGNHCFDEATECLTQRGWVSYQDIRHDDSVLSLDNDKPVWSPIKEIIKYEYSGEMVRIEKTRMSMSVTPKHRVLLDRLNWKTKQYDIREYREADDLPHSFNIPVSSFADSPDAPISDDMIRMCGWILTDGTLEEWGISIYQSKTEGRSKIEALLSKLNLPYKLTERQRSNTHICGRELVKKSMLSAQYRIPAEFAKSIKEYLPEKTKLPQWAHDLSGRQFDVLLEALIDGDGTYNRLGDGCVLYGRSEFLSSVQEVAVHHGYRARLATDNRGHQRLWLVKQPKIRIEKKDVFREQYNGWVWCLQVPLTNFMVRRNGIAYFSGNCARFETRLSAQVPEFEGVQGFLLRDHLPHWHDSLRIDINDDCVIIHDWHNGIHSGWNDVLKGGCHIVTGHTHELSVKAHKGFKNTHYGVKTGMLADEWQDEFNYRQGKPGFNWQSGFVVLTWVNGMLLYPEFAAVRDNGVCYFRGEKYAEP